MGALVSNRKRGADEYFGPSFNLRDKSQYSNSPDSQLFKKPRFCFMNQSPEQPVSSPNKTVSRLSLYPETKSPLRRYVHAPVRHLKYPTSNSTSVTQMFRNLFVAKKEAFGSFRCLNKKEKEVVLLDNEEEEVAEEEVKENGKEKGKGKEAVSDDCSVEEVEVIEKGKDVVEEEERNVQPSSSSVVSELNNGSLGVENAMETLSLEPEVSDVSSLEAYRKLLEESERRGPKLRELGFQIELNEKRRAAIQALRPVKKPEQEEVIPPELFKPLTNEEKALVDDGFADKNWKRILVFHKPSSIEIRGEILQCLKPKEWLNDEVINLYLDLLKEREKREPTKFLKCHFFTTFFYKKLVGHNGVYNYNAVRRWTTQKKLGYGLIDCDKIFVPIHKSIHWCLAVINKKDQKFQYLDSLKGRDGEVLDALAKYYVDEVKDKSGRDIDVSSWEQEYVQDLPAQENGYDCGMFMLKYIDFYSRGLKLRFNQKHMPYFRKRTAKEILRMRAD